MIHFKNTLSGKIENFESLMPKKVGIYTCGPTVYGKVHIGNMRAYVFADLIKSTLLYNGYKVKHVINITDVGHLVGDEDSGDDKVEQQAKKENLSVSEITKMYTNYFYAQLKELNINDPEIIFPKASGHIIEQVEMIKTLEEKGFTYITSDGVYFDTSKFPAYGELGHINIKGLQEGARVEVNSDKKNITDFALWKFSKENRLQQWSSPWGEGFPGWHIECSAMAKKELGETFDIHTGGIDHIPTHHQNEIAQSVCAHDKPLANYWLHVNHITIGGKKISKSIGNTVYLEDLKEHGFSALDYKYWLYTSHYSTLSNFTWEAIQASHKALEILRTFMRGVAIERDSSIKKNIEDGSINQSYKKRFLDFINSNLNTPMAIALMWELYNDKTIHPADKKATILDFDKVLKLNFKQDYMWPTKIPDHVKIFADRRKIARENRNYAEADALREKIEQEGFSIKDTDSEIGYIIEEK